MNKEELKQSLKEHIITYLNLIDFTPEQIADDMALFGDGGLELDSIDSLELIVMLQREFDVKINNPADGRKILIDVNSMADYILEVKK